jgi:hypothetical protein
MALPLVMFAVNVGNAIPGSVSPPGAWEGSLDLTVFADTIDRAREISGEVYDAVWTWDDPFGVNHIVPGLGHVGEITDQTVFSRTGTVDLPTFSQTQYDGSFGLQLHRA